MPKPCVPFNKMVKYMNGLQCAKSYALTDESSHTRFMSAYDFTRFLLAWCFTWFSRLRSPTVTCTPMLICNAIVLIRLFFNLVIDEAASSWLCKTQLGFFVLFAWTKQEMNQKVNLHYLKVKCVLAEQNLIGFDIFKYGFQCQMILLGI